MEPSPKSITLLGLEATLKTQEEAGIGGSLM